MTDEVIISDANIPESIALAVLAVQKSLGVLGKEGTNEFQNYAYVSIDKYYEIVAQVATANDLSWFCKEVSSEIVDVGHNKQAIKFDYVFSMFHGTGEVVPVYDRISIYHPLQGAQTSGSAASYAEKLFMRKAFKVVTGEKDADAADQDFGTGETPEKVEPPKNLEKAEKQAAESAAEAEVTPPPVGEEPPKPGNGADFDADDYVEKDKDGTVTLREIKDPDVANWELIYSVFEKFIPHCKNVKDTRAFWSKNIKAIELLKGGDPKLHENLVAMFKEHQTAVSTKGK